MWDEGVERGWNQAAEGAMLEIRNWRKQHPRATLSEIEAAVDGHWAKVRARLIQEAALASEAKDIGHQGGDSCSRCSECGGQLESRGEKVRKLSTSHDQRIELRRSYGSVPRLRDGDFPPWMRNWVCCRAP